MHRNRIWKYVGVFGIWTNLAIAAYYCYLESWTLSYVMHSVSGTFVGLDQEGVAAFFNEYVNLGVSTLGIPYEPIVFFRDLFAAQHLHPVAGVGQGHRAGGPRWGVPLLIVFGLFLAFQGVTLKAGRKRGGCTIAAWDSTFCGLRSTTTCGRPRCGWRAAGQIFFTLSVGMGTVHCYAAYVRANDDIALSAMSAGWMNEFVEVVIGSFIVIPIAIGYLGIERVTETGATGWPGIGVQDAALLVLSVGRSAGSHFLFVVFWVAVLRGGSPPRWRWARPG